MVITAGLMKTVFLRDTVFFLDYVGTENETILKNVLDEAAHSFRIK